MKSWLLLDRLAGLAPAALLALRVYLGGFLIWGVWDNIVSAARMAEFEAFLAGLNAPLPALAAPVSVWIQFAIGVLLIPGLLTRWAGLFLAANFAVAVVLLAGTGGDGRGRARTVPAGDPDLPRPGAGDRRARRMVAGPVAGQPLIRTCAVPICKGRTGALAVDGRAWTSRGVACSRARHDAHTAVRQSFPARV